MSCFSGTFISLPGVRCDRFDNLNGYGNRNKFDSPIIGDGVKTAPADQFFLSHCHSDHMVGLDTLGAFLRKRRASSDSLSKLYCSIISSVFVQKKYPDIPHDAIVELLPNHPQTVSVSASCEVYSLRVTAVHSNHCPGSVMFMMEKLDCDGAVSKRILYTGDFRFDNPDLSLTSLQALHSGSSPLPIDEMYLDTTFCSTKYLNFPPRKLAEERIWTICEKWIKKNGMFKDNHKFVVLFLLPARYGHEKILQHIYQRSSLKWRVHIPRTKFSEYLCNSSLADCTDPDPNIAPWVHACTTNFKRKFGKCLSSKLPCQPSGGVSVCHIKPSAMFFTQTKMAALQASGQESFVDASQEGSSYRVCYSTHSSMEELERFVKHFSPAQITPCAIPPNSSKEEVGNILAAFLQSSSSSSPVSSIPLPSISLSPHKPMPSVAPTGHNNRYDPDVWVSPSPPESAKRKMEDGQCLTPDSKVLRLQNKDSLSRICFKDTLELENDIGVEEAKSSDDEDDLNADKVLDSHIPTKKNLLNESFSLVLESSDEEDLFDSNHSRDDSIEIIESNQAIASENDTPEIEDLIVDAEVNQLPEYVIKTMKEFKKRKDQFIVIDD